MLRTLPSACISLTSCLTAFLSLPSGSFPHVPSNNCGSFVFSFGCRGWHQPFYQESTEDLGMEALSKPSWTCWVENRYGRKDSLTRGCLSPRQMWWIDRGQYLPWEALWWGPACLRWCFCMHHSSGLQEKLLSPRFFSWHHVTTLLSEALSLL